MNGHALSSQFDHNRKEPRLRISPLGERMNPDVNNEKLMRAGLPEHAAPDWMRITATEVRAAQRGKNCGRPRAAGEPVPNQAGERDAKAIPVIYTNGNIIIHAESIFELSEVIHMNTKSIRKALETGRPMTNGGKVVAA